MRTSFNSGLFYRSVLVCCLLATGGWLSGFSVLHVDGQASSGEQWTQPELLFEDLNGFSRLDFMRADLGGTVHIFWSHNPHSPYRAPDAFDQEDTVIYYQAISQSTRAEPRDVLLNSQATMRFGFGIDAQGVAHMATAIGGPPCVAYLHVPVQQIGDPLAWSQPTCLDSIGVGAPDLAIDRSGQLYVIYPQRGQEALLLIRSAGDGRWSQPVEVARTSGGDVFVGEPRLVVDAQGRLHATWGELEAPGGYPWHHIMYARSLDGGDSWSEPTILADAHQGHQNLAVFEDTVHVVWDGDAGYQGRYYRASEDGGLTWSPRVTLPLEDASGGLQGAPAIVVDSTGTVHILYTDSPTLYYIRRRGDDWSQPLLIAGPENTGAAREINWPMLSITSGNQLHALYTRDAQAVYYQRTTIDAPAEAPVSWPDSAELEPASRSAATAAPSPTPTPGRVQRTEVEVSPNLGPPSDPSLGSKIPPFATGVVVALFVVLAVLGARTIRMER